MAIHSFQELQDLLQNVNKEEMYVNICRNIKKFRLEKYNEFKKQNLNTSINPYSTENISALLDYNHNHYKRFESENDSTKMIPLEKLVKVSIILDKRLDDFIR